MDIFGLISDCGLSRVDDAKSEGAEISISNQFVAVSEDFLSELRSGSVNLLRLGSDLKRVR